MPSLEFDSNASATDRSSLRIIHLFAICHSVASFLFVLKSAYSSYFVSKQPHVLTEAENRACLTFAIGWIAWFVIWIVLRSLIKRGRFLRWLDFTAISIVAVPVAAILAWCSVAWYFDQSLFRVFPNSSTHIYWGCVLSILSSPILLIMMFVSDEKDMSHQLCSIVLAAVALFAGVAGFFEGVFPG